MAADLLALGVAAITAVSVSFFSPPIRVVGFLLLGIAVPGAVSVVIPGRRIWTRRALTAALTLTVATGGIVVIYHNPTPTTVRFSVPGKGDVISTCLVELRFDGKPNRDSAFVVATRQGSGLYYFEASVQQDPSGGPDSWRAQVQAGSKSRGLGERFELFVFAMDQDVARYLSTVRQDLDPTNTFWVARTPPPGVLAPAAATYIRRASGEDLTCPE
ncbi:hypothetical protein GCM10009744_64930 [Kribbella alba]|uniref:DUF4190 domain-containing protein n=1 Tax=Kribbella alba TaxID=190197 RepID=A0ABN2FYL1_9ACTN